MAAQQYDSNLCMVSAKQTYSTSDLISILSVGRNTLRLYEEMGLLGHVKRTESGYRDYSQQHLSRLKFIAAAKEVGFKLNEIKLLLKTLASETKMNCGFVSEEVSKKVQEVEDEITKLNQKKDFLNQFLSTCGAQKPDAQCDVMSVGFDKSACCS